MRIIAGELKGREVHLPRGSRIRPATNFVREMAMNLFENAAGEAGGRISDGIFLDVCAGSGLMGFEALSRGARRAWFVEADYRTAEALRETARRFSVDSRAKVIRCDARRCFGVLAKQLAGERIDAAFLDPPFIAGMAEDILLRLADGAAELYSPRALIIVRTPDELPVALEGLNFIEERAAGQSRLWLYRPATWTPALNVPA